MCPYYFHLEDKFLARAGIKPSATTDELFDCTVDNSLYTDIALDDADSDMNSKSSAGTDVANKNRDSAGNDEANNNRASKTIATASVAKSAKKKKQRTPSKRVAGRGTAEMDGLNALLMTIAKRKSAELAAITENNQTGDNVDKMVSLMTNWKSAREAMGCPIKAAYSCPEFEQFLDRKERKQLRRYRREMEDPLSSDSSE